MNQQVEAASRYEAADATGSIHIAVNHRALVLSVSINDSWRKRLAPDQFADALLGAYRAAIQSVASAAETTRDPAGSGREANQELAKILRDHDAAADDDGHTDWYTGVRAKLDRLERRRRAIKEYVANTKVDPVDREVRGPNGYLNFQLRHGIPVSVTAAVPALRSASTELLRKDAMAAFQAANLTAEF